MIQILPCAGCQRSLVLPVRVSLEASIECPHCHEQFVVGEMLISRLGSWTVLNDPLEQMCASVASEEELTLAPEEMGNSKPKPDWSKFKPVTHEQFERMKRKSRSPIWSMLQVVFGGVAAVPIALLLLWHVLDKDVLDAGPIVGRYVPWIVPEKFRPLPYAPDELASSPAKQQATQSESGSGFRNFDDVLPRPGNTRRDDPTAPMSNEAPASTIIRPDVDSINLPSPGVAMNPNSINEPVPMDEQADAASTPGLESSPEGQNIFSLIQKCEMDLEAWREAVRLKQDLKSLAQVLYSDLTNLATVIAPLPQADPVRRALRDSMQPIGRSVKRQADVQSVVEQGSRFWVVKNAAQPEYPLALVVEIAEVSQEGEMWRLLLTEQTKIEGPNTQVLVPSFLAPELIAGQRLLLLGKLSQSNESAAPAPDERSFQACYLHAL